MSATVAIMGGRGKTGRAVAAAVAGSGGTTRALGRAEMGDLPRALQGCGSLYLIAPNMHPDEPAFVGKALRAARTAGVHRLVYHSVAAPYEPAMPHHVGKAESEVLVRRSGLRWTILQPGVYMQNFLPALTAPDPELLVPYDPERGYTMVDLADIGQVAARVLDDDSYVNATLELGGPRTMNIHDVAADAATALGRDVPVRRLTPAEWRAGPGRGLEERERRWLEAMFDYYDAHGLACGAVATRAVLGREPADFATVIAREVNK